MFRRFLYLKTAPTRAMQLRLQISKADCEASAEIAAPLGEDSKKLIQATNPYHSFLNKETKRTN